MEATLAQHTSSIPLLGELALGLSASAPYIVGLGFAFAFAFAFGLAKVEIGASSSSSRFLAGTLLDRFRLLIVSYSGLLSALFFPVGAGLAGIMLVLGITACFGPVTCAPDALTSGLCCIGLLIGNSTAAPDPPGGGGG